jgi:recombinational DNA repair protein RecR
MRLKLLVVTLISLCFLFGCSQEKVSPEDLINSLQAAGYSASREKNIHHSLEDAEIAFWINLDGNRVSAYCFDTVEKAKLKARTFRDGLNIGYWAFEYVDPASLEKLKKVLEK